jgi:hypothetical protein
MATNSIKSRMDRCAHTCILVYLYTCILVKMPHRIFAWLRRAHYEYPGRYLLWPLQRQPFRVPREQRVTTDTIKMPACIRRTAQRLWMDAATSLSPIIFGLSRVCLVLSPPENYGPPGFSMLDPGAGQAASARVIKGIGTDGRERLIQEGVVLFACNTRQCRRPLGD